MNWYIGQRIVAVVDHSQGKFKKGDEFTIKGLRGAFCGCNKILIDIGITLPLNWSSIYTCAYCGSKIEYNSRIHWFAETCFAPLEPFEAEAEKAVKKLLEETLEVVSL